jgi:hypothetical protein
VRPGLQDHTRREGYPFSFQRDTLARPHNRSLGHPIGIGNEVLMLFKNSHMTYLERKPKSVKEVSQHQHRERRSGCHDGVRDDLNGSAKGDELHTLISSALKIM